VARPEGFRLLSGEAELTRYLFNNGVNLGCLDDVTEEELSRVPVTYVDGRNDRFAAPEHRRHL
jgi:hypothetical protein